MSEEPVPYGSLETRRRQKIRETITLIRNTRSTKQPSEWDAWADAFLEGTETDELATAAYHAALAQVMALDPRTLDYARAEAAKTLVWATLMNRVEAALFLVELASMLIAFTPDA